MAQTLTHYIARAVGGATLYCYEQPHETSRAVRIQNGETLHLPSWYNCEMPGGMVRITQPCAGWMFLCNVTDIQPVYETLIIPCKPPTAVSLDVPTRTLTFTGGQGGELNTLTGYGISWRDRLINSADWSAWTEDLVCENTEFPVSDPPSGQIRQFRIRTLGSAGSSYFSGYVLCKTQLIHSEKPAPVILYPMSGSSSRSAAPWLIVHCPAAEEEQQLYLQIDEEEWNSVTICDANIITESHSLLKNLQPGLHSLRVKLIGETSGSESIVDSALFTQEPFAWSRSIASGDVIASRTVSHRRDLLEMLETLNIIRAYYGLPPIEALPGYVGRLSDWQKQITTLQEGLNEVLTAKEETPRTFSTASWPTASVISQLREAMEEI